MATWVVSRLLTVDSGADLLVAHVHLHRRLHGGTVGIGAEGKSEDDKDAHCCCVEMV